MKALVVGAGGQLGRALAATPPAAWTVMALTRADLDVGDEEAVATAVERAAPDVILNAAAYTAVDKAESEPEAAFRVNRDGAANLARAAKRSSARLVHLSTDFVFDGRRGRPYRPDDLTAPLGVYGASKRAGEEAVLASGADVLIVRTAWVYASEGRNFPLTMLRLMAERGEVRVVADQIGAPTSADSLAAGVWGLARLRAGGVLHLTNAGAASWYDFACAVAELGVTLGLLPRLPLVTPIATEDYPTPAARPAYSVLDCREAWRILGAPPPHWRSALAATLAQIRP